MGIGSRRGGMAAALLATAAVLVVAALLMSSSTPVAAAGRSTSMAVPLDRGAPPPLPCFHACFDQCVPRDDFWFCQFSCYQGCAGSAGGSRAAIRDRGRLGCEQACALSLCARLRPGTKVMAACRDTCRKSYVLAACAQE